MIDFLEKLVYNVIIITKGSEDMKKLYILCLVFMLVFTGCTPKSQLISSAKDILKRVEDTCTEIAGGVEMLNDDYTSGVFEKIKKDISECKKELSDKPSRDDIEKMLVTLSRLEKELGSIKTLSGGMEDYIPEFTFDFANDTDKVIQKIVMEPTSDIQADGYNESIPAGETVSIAYPLDNGTWSITAHISGGDEVSCEGITLSMIKTLRLSVVDGEYEYSIE